MKVTYEFVAAPVSPFSNWDLRRRRQTAEKLSLAAPYKWMRPEAPIQHVYLLPLSTLFMSQHERNAKAVRFKTRTFSETTVSLEWDGGAFIKPRWRWTLLWCHSPAVYGFAYRVHLWAEGAA